MNYKPLRSTIRVHQVHGEDRVYEATTDDNASFDVKAKQVSGPTLDILVSEIRFRFWGGGNPPPEHPSRKHVVRYKPEGAKYAEPMDEIRTGPEVDIFKKYGKPGELGYYIPQIGIVTGEAS